MSNCETTYEKIIVTVQQSVKSTNENLYIDLLNKVCKTKNFYIHTFIYTPLTTVVADFALCI